MGNDDIERVGIQLFIDEGVSEATAQKFFDLEQKLVGSVKKTEAEIDSVLQSMNKALRQSQGIDEVPQLNKSALAAIKEYSREYEVTLGQALIELNELATKVHSTITLTWERMGGGKRVIEEIGDLNTREMNQLVELSRLLGTSSSEAFDRIKIAAKGDNVALLEEVKNLQMIVQGEREHQALLAHRGTTPAASTSSTIQGNQEVVQSERSVAEAIQGTTQSSELAERAAKSRGDQQIRDLARIEKATESLIKMFNELGKSSLLPPTFTSSIEPAETKLRGLLQLISQMRIDVAKGVATSGEFGQAHQWINELHISYDSLDKSIEEYISGVQAAKKAAEDSHHAAVISGKEEVRTEQQLAQETERRREAIQRFRAEQEIVIPLGENQAKQAELQRVRVTELFEATKKLSDIKVKLPVPDDGALKVWFGSIESGMRELQSQLQSLYERAYAGQLIPADHFKIAKSNLRELTEDIRNYEKAFIEAGSVADQRFLEQTQGLSTATQASVKPTSELRLALQGEAESIVVVRNALADLVDVRRKANPTLSEQEVAERALSQNLKTLVDQYRAGTISQKDFVDTAQTVREWLGSESATVTELTHNLVVMREAMPLMGKTMAEVSPLSIAGSTGSIIETAIANEKVAESNEHIAASSEAATTATGQQSARMKQLTTDARMFSELGQKQQEIVMRYANFIGIPGQIDEAFARLRATADETQASIYSVIQSAETFLESGSLLRAKVLGGLEESSQKLIQEGGTRVRSNEAVVGSEKAVGEAAAAASTEAVRGSERVHVARSQDAQDLAMVEQVLQKYGGTQQGTWSLLTRLAEVFTVSIKQAGEMVLWMGLSQEQYNKVFLEGGDLTVKAAAALGFMQQRAEILATAYQPLIRYAIEHGATHRQLVELAEKLDLEYRDLAGAIDMYTKSQREGALVGVTATEASNRAIAALEEIRAKYTELPSVLKAALDAMRATSEAQKLPPPTMTMEIEALEKITKDRELATRVVRAYHAAEMERYTDITKIVDIEKVVDTLYQQITAHQVAQTAAVQQAIASGKQKGASDEVIIKILKEMGVTQGEATKAVKEYGAAEVAVAENMVNRERAIKALIRAQIDANTAYKIVSEAEKIGIKDKELLALAEEQYRIELDRLMSTGLTYAQAVRQMEIVEKNELSTIELSTRAHGRWGASFALFGISMGAMTVIREVEVAVGKLPPVATQAANSIQLLSDGALTGSMILPVYGTVIGAVIGGLVGLGTMLSTQTDPALAELNKKLAEVAKRENVAATLGKIMGWTEAEANAALKATNDNYELAKALDAVAKDREPPTWLSRLTPSIKPGEIIPVAFWQSITMSDDEWKARFTDPAKRATDEAALAIEQAQNKIIESHKQMIAEFERGGSGSAEVQISKTAGVTQEAAKTFITYAQAHSEVSRQAEELSMSIDKAEQRLVELNKTGKGSTIEAVQLTHALRYWKEELAGLITESNKMSAIEEKYKGIITYSQGLGDESKATTTQLADFLDTTIQGATKIQELAKSDEDLQKALHDTIPAIVAYKIAVEQGTLAGQEGKDIAERYVQALEDLQAAAIKAQSIANLDKPWKALEAELLNLQGMGPTAASALAGILGVTEANASSVLNLAKQDENLGNVLIELIPIIIACNKALADGSMTAEQASGIIAGAVGKLKFAIADAFEYAQNHKIGIQADTTAATRAIEDAQRVKDALIKMNEDVARAERTYSEDVFKANRTLADDLSKDAQKLADSLYDIAQSLRDKMEDLDHDYAKQVEEIGDEIVKAKQDLSDKIKQIEKKRIDDLAQLDWDTGLKLRKAKTDHDREEIMLEAEHQRQVINSRADDEISQARKAFDEQMALEDKKMEKLKEDMAWRKYQAEREAAEQIERAQRTYAEETAAAKLKNEEQLADLETRLKDEKADIQQRYDDEIRNIQNATKIALETSALRQQSQANEDGWWRILIQDAATYGAVMSRIPSIGGKRYGPSEGMESGTGGVHYQSGADFVVPSGYENDTYGPLYVSSGEHVSIQPSSQVNMPSTRGSSMSQFMMTLGGIHIDARGMQNPEDIANVLEDRMVKVMKGRFLPLLETYIADGVNYS